MSFESAGVEDFALDSGFDYLIAEGSGDPGILTEQAFFVVVPVDVIALVGIDAGEYHHQRHGDRKPLIRVEFSTEQPEFAVVEEVTIQREIVEPYLMKSWHYAPLL